jgi:hypothetical protein
VVERDIVSAIHDLTAAVGRESDCADASAGGGHFSSSGETLPAWASQQLGATRVHPILRQLLLLTDQRRHNPAYRTAIGDTLAESEDEEERLLQVAPPLLRSMIITALDTGMR